VGITQPAAHSLPPHLARHYVKRLQRLGYSLSIGFSRFFMSEVSQHFRHRHVMNWWKDTPSLSVNTWVVLLTEGIARNGNLSIEVLLGSFASLSFSTRVSNIGTGDSTLIGVSTNCRRGMLRILGDD
jgi:hypothetical protein